jgi:hypothetical protein
MNAVKDFNVLADFKVWLRFDDGFETTVSLKPFLNKGIAKELLSVKEFSKVSIESGGGLAWKNGFDICPNFLRDIAEAKQHVA